MFTAIVLACHITSASTCVQFTDNRGPYKTEEQCETRVEEMLAKIIEVHVEMKSPFLPKEFACVQNSSA